MTATETKLRTKTAQIAIASTNERPIARPLLKYPTTPMTVMTPRNWIALRIGVCATCQPP